MADNEQEPPPSEPSNEPPLYYPPNEPPLYYPPNYRSPPPSPQWPPSPQSQAPPGAYLPASPVNGQLVLILGILGIVCTVFCGLFCGLFCGVMGLLGAGLGIAAWIMGNQGLATLNQIGDPMQQRAMVNAGRICGIVSVVLAVLGAMIFAGILIFSLATSPHHG